MARTGHHARGRRDAGGPRSRIWRAAGSLAVGAACAAALVACGGSDGKEVSAFDVKVGDCLTPPSTVKAEISKLTIRPCSEPHTEEAYAIVDYATTDSSGQSTGDIGYPGSDALTTYANSVCAERFAGYVGVPYTDSSLYFTFLLPSARSWQSANDRSVICFATTTGGQSLTGSIKNSKR